MKPKERSAEDELKTGNVVLFTVDEYSDFRIVDFVLVLKDFNLREQRKAYIHQFSFLQPDPEKYPTYWGFGEDAPNNTESGFVDYLVSLGFVQKCEYSEHHLGSYDHEWLELRREP